MPIRKLKHGLVLCSEDEREYERTPENTGCCNKHFLPANDFGVCEDYEYRGYGILIDCCENCVYRRK